MRTTIDLEDDLLRNAKIEAVRRGITLRQLISSTLEKELATKSEFVPEDQRVNFPIFDSKQPGKISITPEMISALDEEEDLRQWSL